MKTNILCSLTLLVMANAASPAGVAQPATPESGPVLITPELITQFAEEMRTNHPALMAAEARVAAATINELTVRRWEDPMVRFGGMAAETMMRADDGDLLYGIEQKLPLFGKPQANRSLARAETGVVTADADLRFQRLRRDLAVAVFQTALADRVVEIGWQDLKWLETLVSVAKHRYETGDTPQLDVLRLENERARRQTRLQTEIELRRQSRVNLNRMLNRPLDSRWPDLLLPNLARPLVFNQKLIDRALKFEPGLNLHRQQVAQAEAAVVVARRERYPDVSVGAEARNYSRNGEFRQGMLMLSFNLPLGNRKRYAAAIQREQARTQSTELELADAELALRNEIHELIARIDAARREALVYQDEIVPRSRAALASAQAAWESGRGMMIDLLDARRMLLEAQVMQARAVAEQYEWLSDLVLCCGLGDLEALEMIGALPENQNGGVTR